MRDGQMGKEGCMMGGGGGNREKEFSLRSEGNESHTQRNGGRELGNRHGLNLFTRPEVKIRH